MRFKRFKGAWAGQAFARQIGLQLLLLIATLAAAELILRIVDLPELRDGRYNDGSWNIFQPDPEIGWIPDANKVATFTGSKSITVRGNSFGLRDIEHDQSVRPTVMFVGDSFVWGYDVEASERFTDLLRDQLPQIRIVNAGVVGYGTDQEYLLLHRLWKAFEPDVVVLMFCVDNDRQDNATSENLGYYKPYLVRGTDGRWNFAGQPVPKPRQFYFVDNPLARNAWLARAAITAYLNLRYPSLTVPDPTEELIVMMRDLVVGHHAKFIVGLQFHEPRIEAFLRSQEIPFTSFDGAETFADQNHWTPAGHQLVSTRVKSLLGATGVLALPGSASITSSGQRP